MTTWELIQTPDFAFRAFTEIQENLPPGWGVVNALEIDAEKHTLRGQVWKFANRKTYHWVIEFVDEANREKVDHVLDSLIYVTKRLVKNQVAGRMEED